jgi:hypothetical protein
MRRRNEVKLEDHIRLGVWIALACDADYRTLSNGSSKAARTTIAEALEVLK